MSEPRAVVAIDRRDWKTLERFGKPSEAAEYYGCSIATVRRACTLKHMRRGEYVCFRWEDDCRLEDEHPHRKGEALPVVGTRDGRAYRFPDIPTAAAFFGQPTTVMAAALARGTLAGRKIKVERMDVVR